jgi:transcriptional regulator with GAF, ATPase, and Fis domain
MTAGCRAGTRAWRSRQDAAWSPIPALIARQLAGCSPAPVAHVSLVEQCLLRAWPGNVRELLAEIRDAAQAAADDGNRVNARHLASTAGSAFGGPRTRTLPSRKGPRHHRRTDPTAGCRSWMLHGTQRIEDALRANAGKVAAAARALGLHRTQLRRLIARHKIAIDLSDSDE